MTAEVQTTPPSGGQSLLEVGDFVAGRFSIEAEETVTPLFACYQGTDTETDGPVLILAVAGEHDDAARAAAAAAKAVAHKNLARLIAVGEEEGRTFLAYEYHEGHSLRQLLQRKQSTGGGAFNPKGALNIITHIGAALGAAHPELVHGCLGLDTVIVNKAGRVVVVGLGLAAFLPTLARAGGMPAWPSIAPEVLRGAKASAASDIYSVGSLIYYALVGSDPVKGCKRPSEAAEGLSAAVDAVVAQSMNPTPSKRFPESSALVAALRASVARPSMEQAAAAPAVSAQMPAVAPAADRSKAGRPSLAQEIVSADFDTGADSELQVSAALQAALADTDERFLINMGNLDYGPFSLAAIVEKIRSGEIKPGHLIIDRDSGNRQAVEEQPLLADLVEQAKQRRDEERRASAEEVHASQEKRRGFALYGFIALGVLALGGGAFLLVSKLAADKGGDGSAEIASLGDGELQVKITPIKRSKRKGKRSGKRRPKGAGSGGTAGGWDDSLDLNMAEGGGSERLDDSQINPVIQRSGGSLGRCLGKTGARHADIDFIIVGSGRVSQVRVNGKTSGPLANCIRGGMKRMKFPSFNGPRTKANFNMSL